MAIKKISVMERDWDYLIVLDACRYDYFSEIYKDYFIGELEKGISLGRYTLEWWKNSFKHKYDDVIYVSANPYINSKIEIKGLNAQNYFHRIIDVWEDGWNDDLGTVPPSEVNKSVIENMEKYPHKRMIIHYLQPHEPYLGYNYPEAGYPRHRLDMGLIFKGTKTASLHKDNKFVSLIKKLALKLLGLPLSYRVQIYTRKLLGLPPFNPMDAVQRRVGDVGLRRLYIENLRIALKYVSELIEELDGTIIITSDHGDLLGEDGYYGHGEIIPHSNPILREIPWLKIQVLSPFNQQR